MVCGSADFIAEARRARKVVGGGMRQAGIIAAAGIVALEQMVDRLTEDHARAKHLQAGLARVPGIEVAPANSNILYFRAVDVKRSPLEIEAQLAARGILLNHRGGGRFRAVTHYWTSDEDIERAIQAMHEVIT
jgi:threonine aldolase